MLCQQLLSTTAARASFWKDKAFFLFEKRENFILGTCPFTYCLWRPPMRAFNSTQTLDHQLTNRATAAVSNNAADLGKLRPCFLLYQQERRQGHCTCNSGDVTQNVDPAWSRARWTPKVSHGGFQLLCTVRCINRHLTHCTSAAGRGKTQTLIPQNISPMFWNSHGRLIKVLQPECHFKLDASQHWEGNSVQKPTKSVDFIRNAQKKTWCLQFCMLIHVGKAARTSQTWNLKVFS